MVQELLLSGLFITSGMNRFGLKCRWWILKMAWLLSSSEWWLIGRSLANAVSAQETDGVDCFLTVLASEGKIVVIMCPGTELNIQESVADRSVSNLSRWSSGMLSSNI